MSISGEVHYDNDEPAGMIPVRLESSLGSIVGSVSTDESGSFSFENLIPGGYDVIVEHAGYQPLRVSVSVRTFPVVGLRLTLVAYKTPDSASKHLGPSISVPQLQVPEKAYQELQRGRKNLEAGKPADAVSHLQKAVTLDPQYAWAFMLLAAAYADQGRFPSADQAIHQALQLDNENAHGYAYLGYVYDKENHIPEAKRAFERSIHLLDADWFAHLELGRLLLREHDAAGAYPHLLRAHQLHPSLPSVHLLLYDDLLTLGHKREALAELDDFITRFPDDPQTPRIRQVRRSLAESLAQPTASSSHR